MKHSYRDYGFIFDLDGVIVDTAILHYQAWRRLANSLGFDFTHDQNEELKGVSRIESLKIILNWGGVSMSENEMLVLASRKNEWYIDLIEHLSPSDALPGAIDFVEKCSSLGIMIGLGSASKNARAVLDRLDITSLFDVIIDGNAVQKSKPNPEVFLKGSVGLGVEPSHCAVFEDALVGIQAALAGGMTAVGIGDLINLREANIVYPNLAGADYHIIINLIDQ
ncbi:MAG TPA: beta-phosphoglucomutase [Saprospiraceae bacterium]|nr:beta-phosphoglucomutase [Saprospiraceae bacterium]HQW56350.1 beta-phosphoglucomutase [Saprospiraceae bacterium]